jgi:uncharacterized protein (TIGR00369 family)
MSSFEPRHSGFESRVRDSFAEQKLMGTIGASLISVLPGAVEINLPFSEAFTQQNGYLHAGIITAIVDSACGYAALSLMPEDSDVLTVEYKVNFVSPASGERMIARGRVTKPGRTLTVCAGDVMALDNGKEKLIATMLATMMAIK